MAGVGIVYKNKNVEYKITSLHYAKKNKFKLNDSLLDELKSLDENKLLKGCRR